MSIVVVIPSRGRPERCWEAVMALHATAVLVDTAVIVAIDEDDPRAADYAAWESPFHGPAVWQITLPARDTGNLTRATNTVSLRVAQDDPSAIIGNLGDDQLARTRGWDRMVTDAMASPGFIYGNDLFQGEALPCGGIFIHAAIVNALGWYALPATEHLFIDNAWGDLGRAIGRLSYLPDMVFEHMHPLAGKAEWDEGYKRANNQIVIDRDRIAYEHWRDEGGLAADAGRIRAALEMAA